MLELQPLTVADELACWQEYSRMLARDASTSLQDMREEAKWAAHWEYVFDQLGKAERSADADAVVFGTK